KRLGLDENRFCVAVVGGSLGSGVLNDVVRSLVRDHAADSGLGIRHMGGERFYDAYRRSLLESGIAFTETSGSSVGLQYQIIEYEHDMAAVYAAADVVVGRGGAGTVAEIAVTGTPAILVPWAGAAEDHQTHNVRWLADQGGAIHLPEHECAQRLPALLQELRSDPAKSTALGRVAHAAGTRSREGAIAALVEQVAGGRR
ncbi:MAG: UDP-N-acetylglucosamine--N-acetylmuramyl-(pentapeptide) pyrophosphoryl-undecaprenol N-acetylglucosamine transferase, partial [Ilumatobacteraceae bacterium]